MWIKPRTRTTSTAGLNVRQRIAKYGVEAERVIKRKVYERDDWRCGICHMPVDRSLVYPHRMSASLDHVVPISQGGGHTYANTQCAHWICNVKKGNRSLVG